MVYQGFPRFMVLTNQALPRFTLPRCGAFFNHFFGLLCQLHEENDAHGGGHRASVADGRNPRNPKNRTGMGVNLPTIPMRNPSGSSYKPQHTINSQLPFLLVKTCHNHISRKIP